MHGKRKRSRAGKGPAELSKRQRVSGNFRSKDAPVKEALLIQYYPNVLCLRDYLLSKLPTTSKVRRKKILSVGIGRETSAASQEDGADADDEPEVANFLNSTLVGISSYDKISKEDRLKEWTSFSQRGGISISGVENSGGGGFFSQSEIVDFSIWLLFSKSNTFKGNLQHLLCQGYRKDVSSRAIHNGNDLSNTIPGVNLLYPNSHVTSMKAWPWPHVLALLGKAGEQIMIDMILDCGVFLQIESVGGNYYQLSGLPLSELSTLSVLDIHGKVNPAILPQKGIETKQSSKGVRSATQINFVRTRILYGKAAINAQGGVRFGFRQNHVLNRYSCRAYGQLISRREPHQNITHLMMYIFPRQFGLHNAFTSTVDTRETVQPFKDYTLRDDEIGVKYSSGEKIKLPKRLRGKVGNLVQKLQTLHARCSYSKLLEHYCSASRCESNIENNSQEITLSISTNFETQTSMSSHESVDLPSSIASIATRKPTLMDSATPIANVSAFCRAVLQNIIPHEFWGSGEVQSHNEQVFHRHVGRFIEMRRYENLSLHEASQDLKIAEIEWLRMPNTADQKLSQTDFNKCREIFLEFLYYVFDSILIPLIRAHFHVTESNVHRQRLFFFRHDVWKSLAEPALTSLKLKMFEEVKLEEAQRILDSRALGFSQIRLLPKESGVRPIMNLRRRVMQKDKKGFLRSSINSVLAPVHNVFAHEKTTNASRLGSTLFSVGDIHPKIKNFKSSIQLTGHPFYFAKVDVQAAFDTIPQSAVIRLMRSIPSETEYRIAKHVEIKPTDAHSTGLSSANKPIRRWKSLAKSLHHLDNFDEDLETHLAIGKKNTVFVENVVNQIRDTKSLLDLLTEHISNNMVKIGKKFYRQKEGIPQGSVLSSLLCNYFYADLEARHLNFLQSDESLLLRLIDDFLLITVNPSHAKRFLQVMHNGVPEYGVGVNPDKTLTNFEVMINGKKIKRLVAQRKFPYCGNMIDVKTLDITRDRERRKDMAIEDSLTVEYSRVPGKTFHRKVLSTLHIQTHPMYLDTQHNSLSTVHLNIHSAFVETAQKMLAYIRCLPVRKRPKTKLVCRTIRDVIAVGRGWGRGRDGLKSVDGEKTSESEGKDRGEAGTENGKEEGKEHKKGLNQRDVRKLGIDAFLSVLRRRQTGYKGVVDWLEEWEREERSGKGKGKGKGRAG